MENRRALTSREPQNHKPLVATIVSKEKVMVYAIDFKEVDAICKMCKDFGYDLQIPSPFLC